MPTTVSLDTRAAPPPPRRRRPGWLPAALIAGAAALGVLIGAAAGGDSDSAALTAAASTSPQPGAPLDAHADEEEPDVQDLPLSRVNAGQGGTRRGPGGVPVGFRQTRDGAAAAATVYLQALSSSGLYLPAPRAAVLAAVGDPVWLARQRPTVEAAIAAEGRALGLTPTGQAPTGTSVRSVTRPTWGAYRLAAYSSASAEVVIWHYVERGVAASTGPAPRGTWRTSAVRLRWAGGDWKVTALPAHQAGPTPSVASRTAPPVFERARLLGRAWHLYANTDT